MAAGADDLPLPDRFRRDGFARFPGFLGPSRIAALRGACDAALAGWQKAEGRGPRAPDVTNMAFLTDLRLWPGDRAEMLQIAEFVASPAVLALVERAAGGPVLLHNTQYFMEPHTRSWDGDWHRDTQFLAHTDDIEWARIRASTGVHFRVALVDDPWFEIVPGSQARWDTAEEYAVRRSSDAATRRGPMPGGLAVPLRAGDALLFHAWAIHRGRYSARQPRRTLDIIYGIGGPNGWGVPSPGSFREPAVMDALSPGARVFYDRFVAAYRPFWNRR